MIDNHYRNCSAATCRICLAAFTAHAHQRAEEIRRDVEEFSRRVEQSRPEPSRRERRRRR